MALELPEQPDQSCSPANATHPQHWEAFPQLTYHFCGHIFNKKALLVPADIFPHGALSWLTHETFPAEISRGKQLCEPFADWDRGEPHSGMAQTLLPGQIQVGTEAPQPRGLDLCACTGAEHPEGRAGRNHRKKSGEQHLSPAGLHHPAHHPHPLQRGSLRASPGRDSPNTHLHPSALSITAGEIASSCSPCSSQAGLLPFISGPAHPPGAPRVPFTPPTPAWLCPTPPSFAVNYPDSKGDGEGTRQPPCP